MFNKDIFRKWLRPYEIELLDKYPAIKPVPPDIHNHTVLQLYITIAKERARADEYRSMLPNQPANEQ